MTQFFVYILISEKPIAYKWSYVGYTSNLEQRLNDHQRGKTKATKPYRPLIIIHSEIYFSKEEARKRELYLKSGSGREVRYQIISKYCSGIV